MDEPFGALDAQTRPSAQELLVSGSARHDRAVRHPFVDEALLLRTACGVLGAPGVRQRGARRALPRRRELEANPRSSLPLLKLRIWRSVKEEVEGARG